MFEGSEIAEKIRGSLDLRHLLHPWAFFLWPQSRLVLENNFKAFLTQISFKRIAQIQLAQHIVRWWNFVNTATNSEFNDYLSP